MARRRIACAAHVSTYTATALVAVLALAWRTDVDCRPTRSRPGSRSRRSRTTSPIGVLRCAGSPTRPAGTFYRLNAGGLNGAYLLDQSWHIGWLFVAALVIGGGA